MISTISTNLLIDLSSSRVLHGTTESCFIWKTSLDLSGVAQCSCTIAHFEVTFLLICWLNGNLESISWFIQKLIQEWQNSAAARYLTLKWRNCAGTGSFRQYCCSHCRIRLTAEYTLCTLHSIHSVFNIVYPTAHTVPWRIHTVHCTQCTKCVLHSVQSVPSVHTGGRFHKPLSLKN